MIELDGSHGEGGGQILRTSLALALITRQAFRLKNVRAWRTKPGLQPQHLMSVRAATTIGQARVQGASLGSTNLVFEPGEIVPGNYHFRIGTAGATGLVLHTVYLPLALAREPSVVSVEGGTHVSASPSFHFLDATWRGYMSLVGVAIDLRMERPGFYPRGGGLIEARIAGSATVKDLDLQSLGEVTDIQVRSIVAGLPASIARRQAERVRSRLGESKMRLDVKLETVSYGPGTVVVLALETQPVPTVFVALGQRGKPAEKVADEAVDQAENYLRIQPTGIDVHSADQLLLPLAMAQGSSRFRVSRISRHLLTNAYVIRQFVRCRVGIDGVEGESGEVHVEPGRAEKS